MLTRRFERSDETGARRFWEIELDGARLVTRRGKLEGLVDAKARELPSRAHALAEVELLVLARLREGWHELGAPAPARAPPLEAAIVDAPADETRWAVYADWLQAQGDAFGEPLGLALAGMLDDAALEAWTWSSELRWLCERDDLGDIATLERRHGFVLAARIARAPAGWGSRVPERLLAALLRCPASRLLGRLALGRLGEQVVALLGEHDSIMLEHLRELVLGDFAYPAEGELSWERIGALERVLAACPELRTLHVRGAGLELASPCEHAALRALTLETPWIDRCPLEVLLSCSLPALRRFELWVGQPRDAVRPADFEPPSLASLAPLLDAPARWPALRELGLVNSALADALPRRLADSPLLAQLERLDLSRGTMHEPGARALLEHAAAFAHLRELDLRENLIPLELAAALERALPGIVRVDAQRDPTSPDRMGMTGYYVSVYE